MSDIKRQVREAPCMECGMVCAPGEFHPLAACLMFKECENAGLVRDSLDFPLSHPRDSNWHRHHVAVQKAALQMVRNALRTDGENGKAVRLEMLAELDAATFDLSPPEPKLIELQADAKDAARYRWLRVADEKQMAALAGSYGSELDDEIDFELARQEGGAS